MDQSPLHLANHHHTLAQQARSRNYQVGFGSTGSREVAAQLAKMFRDVVEVTDGVGGPVLERWQWTGRAWQRTI